MGVRQSFLQPRLGHVAHLVWVDYGLVAQFLGGIYMGKWPKLECL